jgi:transposase-like protein
MRLTELALKIWTPGSVEFPPDSGQDGCRKEGTMTRQPRRNHTPAFKAKVALAAIKGEKALAELVQQFDVHARSRSGRLSFWKELPGCSGPSRAPRRRRRPSISNLCMPRSES